MPKVKLNIPGKNEDEVVVKRKGRFKILKDAAVTVVAPGPGAGSGQASESAAAGAAAITDGPPARVGESSAVSSGAIEAKVHQSSARVRLTNLLPNSTHAVQIRCICRHVWKCQCSEGSACTPPG